MIFQPKSIELSIEGIKTQTRRVSTAADVAGVVLLDDPKREMQFYFPEGLLDEVNYMIRRLYKWGRLGSRLFRQVYGTYAMQPGRNKSAVARMRIEAIRIQKLMEISIADIRAEGVGQPYFENFEKLWDSLNDAPGRRWRDNPTVWVYEYVVVEAEP